MSIIMISSQLWSQFNFTIAVKFKKVKSKSYKAAFCSVFYDFFRPHSFIHSISLSFGFPCYRCTVETGVLLSDFFFFFPVFPAPCRIQWHSFLMRLLSLLISVSSGKMNDSRPCNKYNMRCINFSENKNGRHPLLYPFQMFRFMAFSMSASFFKLCSRNIFPSH